jgi:hypothetical protein
MDRQAIDAYAKESAAPVDAELFKTFHIFAWQHYTEEKTKYFKARINGLKLLYNYKVDLEPVVKVLGKRMRSQLETHGSQ